ncbi:hypothetical protein [Chryseobacterium daeguense]|uniref:hypothetical protein n=1 Tax=Chryseobacterium daeguense TaxID=412438 RepID=UPI00048869B5|nr:hypothetical protein [Chryseobacterium daeguense]
MRNYFLLAAAGAMSLLSCTAMDQKKQTAQKTIKLQFNGSENTVITNPKFTVSLHGHDKFLVVAPATLISEKEYEQKSVPFTIDLPIPDDAQNRINPKPAGPVNYYITLKWDSNGDGQVNKKGDLFIDFDKKFPNVSLSGQTQEIYLKVLK